MNNLVVEVPISLQRTTVDFLKADFQVQQVTINIVPLEFLITASEINKGHGLNGLRHA